MTQKERFGKSIGSWVAPREALPRVEAEYKRRIAVTNSMQRAHCEAARQFTNDPTGNTSNMTYEGHLRWMQYMEHLAQLKRELTLIQDAINWHDVESSKISMWREGGLTEVAMNAKVGDRFARPPAAWDSRYPLASFSANLGRHIEYSSVAWRVDAIATHEGLPRCCDLLYLVEQYYGNGEWRDDKPLKKYTVTRAQVAEWDWHLEGAE